MQTVGPALLQASIWPCRVGSIASTGKRMPREWE